MEQPMLPVPGENARTPGGAGVQDRANCRDQRTCGPWPWPCTLSSSGVAIAASLVQRSLNSTLPSGRYSLVRQLQLAVAVLTAGATTVLVVSPGSTRYRYHPYYH